MTCIERKNSKIYKRIETAPNASYAPEGGMTE